MPFPPARTLERFGYTAVDTTPAVQPGTWKWAGASRSVDVFVAFDAGNGPVGSDFTVDVLVNGVAATTIVCPDGDDDALAADTSLILADGDLLSFEITDDAGSTGPVTFGFTY